MSDNHVEFDGLCAFAVSLGKTDVKGGSHMLMQNGKRYVFSNLIAKVLFMILANRAQKAEIFWAKQKELNNEKF